MRTRRIAFLRSRKWGTTGKPSFFERQSTGLVAVTLEFLDWNASPYKDPAVTGEMIALELMQLDSDSDLKLQNIRISHVKIGEAMFSTREGGGRKEAPNRTDWLFYLSPSNDKEPA